MSKDRDEGTWDAREAFHRAAMEVYGDLGKLLRILAAQPDRQVALVQLGEIVAAKAGPERGDAKTIKAMKRAVLNLRASLATVEAIRGRAQGASNGFWLGSQSRTWGGVGSGSFHEVVIGAASAMLEVGPVHPVGGDSRPAARHAASSIQKQVIADGLDEESWAGLAVDLEAEFKRALLLPKPTEIETTAKAIPTVPQSAARVTQPALQRQDENVESVFHLLRHYKDFVCAPDWSIKDDATEHAIDQLEAALRLKNALATKSSGDFLAKVLSAVGDRSKARNLLMSADLHAERRKCLEAMARATIRDGSSAAEIFAACRSAAQHWRTLQPTVYESAGRGRYVMDNDVSSARHVGQFWSLGVDRCPSRLGAALNLAVACKALAKLGRDLDPNRDFAPAVRLARQLQEFPDWGRLDHSAMPRVVDQQTELVRQVEELTDLAEIAAGALSRQKDATLKKAARPRIQKWIDDAGYDALCLAWDGQDPDHRELPTWELLAEAVHKELGLGTKVASTRTALKQRCPRTRAKWEDIQKEIAQEKMARGR